MIKVAYVEWPDGLSASGEAWETIKAQISAADVDVLITNEMPFGAWRPVDHEYGPDQAKLWAEEHERSLDALAALDASSIISSRPVIFEDRLVNEAFLLQDDEYKVMHHKHYFPAEEGWHETSWFKTKTEGFDLTEVGDLKVGVLLCTELMFPEKARDYGRLGANLIVSPRASGTNLNYWEAACAMASVVSGAYVISSNRVGKSEEHLPEFGGVGLAYNPGGIRAGNTSPQSPVQIIDIDVEHAKQIQTEYPCYLKY